MRGDARRSDALSGAEQWSDAERRVALRCVVQHGGVEWRAAERCGAKRCAEWSCGALRSDAEWGVVTSHRAKFPKSVALRSAAKRGAVERCGALRCGAGQSAAMR